MLEREHENGLILGLLAQCRVRATVDDCPLAYLEGLSLDAQIMAIEQLSDGEVAEIVSHHLHCMEQHTHMA